MTQVVFRLPDIGEGIVEAEIVTWYVAPGDHVTEDQPLVEITTEKANVEIPSPYAGTITAVHGAPGEAIAVGADLVEFETAGAPAEANPAEQPAKAPARAEAPSGASPPSAARPQPPPEHTNRRVLTSPALRHRARQAGIDISAVNGTGRQGRITAEDLQRHLDGVAARQPVRDAVDEIKVTGVRRVIAERMAASMRDIPHFSYIEEVDVTELEKLRQHLNRERAAALTYLAFLGVALVRAAKQQPGINATYDAERQTVLRHRDVHLGIAAQTDQGLKVPVIKHAESMNLFELAESIARVGAGARDGKLGIDELRGSTITITSLGALGGIASTPIINAPEVAIIGVNRAVERPVVIDNGITIRRMMNLSSSFDHRFVDGFDGAQFVQRLKQFLEHPATLFID